MQGGENICHDIVVGVGINVYKSDFPEDIKDTAGFIEEKDDTDKREELVIKIMQNFLEFWSEDRDSLVEKYRKKLRSLVMKSKSTKTEIIFQLLR